ncbi:MAG: efflux RND transporter periplasmic adaptor subunit [Muribaculaceae bacterium]|nr:efflux RND transporter periplasmic adaptor subunit [Muribaculaceae bacterium]
MRISLFRGLILSFASLVCSATLSSCGGSDKQSATTDSIKDETPVVEVAEVCATEVPLSQIFTATVEADNLNNIAPAMANRIRQIKVDVGDPVTRGQVLVIMDNSSLDQLKINLQQMQRDYDRAQQLLTIGSGTQMAVEQARTQLDAAKRQYENAVENTTLVSPITGVVTARNYDPGDMSGAQPILTVGQLKPDVKAIINVSESYISDVTKGSRVQVTFDAYPDQTITGTVSRIYPTVDPATRTFATEILIPNADGRIRPGMFARVNLDRGSRLNVVVPDRAVVKQTGSGNRYVYVYNPEDGTVSFNRVELGTRLDDAYEVLSGVANGDKVVISGQTRLADGVTVTIKE